MKLINNNLMNFISGAYVEFDSSRMRISWQDKISDIINDAYNTYHESQSIRPVEDYQLPAVVSSP